MGIKGGKICDTCIYGHAYELDKPCIVYCDDCPLYQKVGDEMTRDEAIKRLRGILTESVEFENSVCYVTEEDREPLEMAIKALENISHITDRPCDVCDCHTENGCTQWKCVFCDELFGGVRR